MKIFINTPHLYKLYVSHLKNGWLATYAEFFQNRRKFLVSNVKCQDAGIAKKDPKDTPDRLFNDLACSITFGTEGVLFTVYCA